MTDDVSRVCAIGRWITHPERDNDLDWTTPCPGAVWETLPLGRPSVEHGFCEPHGQAIFKQLAILLLDCVI